MTNHTADDFKAARFAESDKRGLAVRMSVDAEYQWTDFQGDCWTDESMAESAFHWAPVYESSREEVQQLLARIAKYEEYLKELRRKHGLGSCTQFKSLHGYKHCDRCGWVEDEHSPDNASVSLAALRIAWENAEQPTAENPIRPGDVVIMRFSEGEFGVERVAEGRAYASDARVLSRAPRREPWADLADVLGEMTFIGTDESAEALARMLHVEYGVRVTDRRGRDD